MPPEDSRQAGAWRAKARTARWWRAGIDPEPIDRDGMARRFVGIVPVRAHAVPPGMRIMSAVGAAPAGATEREALADMYRDINSGRLAASNAACPAGGKS